MARPVAAHQPQRVALRAAAAAPDRRARPGQLRARGAGQGQREVGDVQARDLLALRGSVGALRGRRTRAAAARRGVHARSRARPHARRRCRRCEHLEHVAAAVRRRRPRRRRRRAARSATPAGPARGAGRPGTSRRGQRACPRARSAADRAGRGGDRLGAARCARRARRRRARRGGGRPSGRR